MRPFRELQPVSGLREQLDSVIPFLPPEERFLSALELIHTWFQGGQDEEQGEQQDEEQDEGQSPSHGDRPA